MKVLKSIDYDWREDIYDILKIVPDSNQLILIEKMIVYVTLLLTLLYNWWYYCVRNTCINDQWGNSIDCDEMPW